MRSPNFAPRLQRLLPVVLIVGLIALAYTVLEPFLVSITWAGILAYITWPVFIRMRAWCGGRQNLSALIAVLLMGTTIVFPMLWLVYLIEEELVVGYGILVAYLAKGNPSLPGMILNIPWLGDFLQNWLTAHLEDTTGLKLHVAQWVAQESSQIVLLFGGIGRTAAKLAFALITLFFFYRDGEYVFHQVRDALRACVGERVDLYLCAAGNMSRAIVISVIFAALVQGLIAALGYWLIDVNAPGLLGLATGLASVVPVFGTVLIWGPICAGLLLDGQYLQALGLIAWGVFLIHPADNLIRPLLISNVTSTPILLTMFGVLGGLAAFGLVGLFVGPVILAVGSAVWIEWTKSIASTNVSANELSGKIDG